MICATSQFLDFSFQADAQRHIFSRYHLLSKYIQYLTIFTFFFII